MKTKITKKTDSAMPFKDICDATDEFLRFQNSRQNNKKRPHSLHL
ncbi:MAG: hypothetical protein RR365_07260 [Bacteroides sp.]